jgi:hypothetical protein
MAIRKVSLKIRIKAATGKRVIVSPVWEKKGRLKPLWAWVKGVAEHHPEGIYALRYGTKWEYCGQHIDVVMATKLRRQQELLDAVHPASRNKLNPVAVTPITDSGPKILETRQRGPSSQDYFSHAWCH